MKTPQIVDAETLARILQVKPDTVYIWARQNRIPSIQITARTRRFDLVAVLASLRTRDGGDR